MAAHVRSQVQSQTADLTRRYKKQPGLAVILVGDDPASQVYVGSKIKACAEVGFASFEHKLPATVSLEDLKSVILQLNADPLVHGILVQLPLPKHLPEFELISLVDPSKDVDCLTSYNLGRLMQNKQIVSSCTPAGVIEILKYYKYDLSGTNAVVIGRSQIVGLPMAQLLVQANATVTTAHSKTKNLVELTSKADVVVVAAGRPEMFGREYFRAGAVVIDVGIHRSSGNKLCGDVKFSEMDHVEACTPVPGGVGPMTIAMLLKNCLELYRVREEKSHV